MITMEPIRPAYYTVLTMSVNTMKANRLTSHYSGQPRTVTSWYKYAAPRKDEKAKPF